MVAGNETKKKWLIDTDVFDMCIVCDSTCIIPMSRSQRKTSTWRLREHGGCNFTVHSDVQSEKDIFKCILSILYQWMAITLPITQVCFLTTEEFLPNIAKSKSTTSSSVYHYQPSVAVDGDLTATWSSESCFHVAYDDFSPWWQVDLLDNYVIVEVRVTGREDCCRKTSVLSSHFKLFFISVSLKAHNKRKSQSVNTDIT